MVARLGVVELGGGKAKDQGYKWFCVGLEDLLGLESRPRPFYIK